MENEHLIVNVCGSTTDYYDSYGKKLCELVRGLNARGVYANVYTQSELVRDNQPEDVQALLRRPILPATGGIMLGYPTNYNAYPDMVHGGPTMGVTAWESTVLPVGWVEALERVDAVSVGSHFVKDVLVKSGINPQKVHVQALGVSEAYQYVERPRRRSPFKFLTYAAGGRRKGWDVAILAFWQAFGADRRYELIVKARPGKFKFALPQPNIHLLAQDMTEPELAQLFADVDCFVFPTRGEGFGLPVREAAGTGLPVITTNWGGTADDLQQWGYPIRSKLAPAWSGNQHMNALAPPSENEFPAKLRGLGEWAEPDVNHLAEQMQHVATGKLIRTQARKSAANVRKLYSWQRFADQVLEVYKQQVAKYPIKGRRKAQHVKAGRTVL